MVRKMSDIRVFDIFQETAERFAKEMGGRALMPDKIEVAGSPNEALSGADIAVTATTSPTPLFDGDDLSAHIHTNSVGRHAPTVRELDTKTVVSIGVQGRRFRWICATPGVVISSL